MTVSGCIAGAGVDCTGELGVGEVPEAVGVGVGGLKAITAATRPMTSRTITTTAVLFMEYSVCRKNMIFQEYKLKFDCAGVIQSRASMKIEARDMKGSTSVSEW